MEKDFFYLTCTNKKCFCFERIFFALTDFETRFCSCCGHKITIKPEELDGLFFEHQGLFKVGAAFRKCPTCDYKIREIFAKKLNKFCPKDGSKLTKQTNKIKNSRQLKMFIT